MDADGEKVTLLGASLFMASWRPDSHHLIADSQSGFVTLDLAGNVTGKVGISGTAQAVR